jgi:hypothetical protein
MEKVYLSTLEYDNNEIIYRRDKVRQGVICESYNIKCGKIIDISADDLKLIFKLYDKCFFNSYFKENFNGVLDFSLSKRLTRSAGVTVKYKNNNKKNIEKYEIKIGINFFLRFDELSRDKMVNGIYTKDSLDALLLVMEHEICHLIEFHVYGDSNCKGIRFRGISSRLFNHNGRYHQLPTNIEIANERFGLRVGDNVCFEYEGRMMKGIIYRINVRATVMVNDRNGQYCDGKGERYAKWYIPLKELKRL